MRLWERGDLLGRRNFPPSVFLRVHPEAKELQEKNENSHGLKVGTMLCMPRPTWAVYSNCTSEISGVSYEKKREKWRAQIVLRGKNHFLGYFDKKEDAIKARIEGERKYWESKAGRSLLPPGIRKLIYTSST